MKFFAKPIAATVFCSVLFILASIYCYHARGYFAIGGEAGILLYPVFVWALAIYDYYKNGR